MPTHVSYPAARRLAVEADVDPRTILRAARGEPVRGMAGERANAALAAAGLLPATAAVPTTDTATK